MAELYIREGDLESTSRRLVPIAAEVGSQSITDVPSAEEQGMKGTAESDLPGLVRDLERFLSDLATRIDEASDDCLVVAADFANVDEAFERAFEVTIEG